MSARVSTGELMAAADLAANSADRALADPSLGSSGERWFVPELQLRPLAAQRGHVRNPLNGATTELSSGEYAVLAACEGSRPLVEHVARAARQLCAPPEHWPAFRDVLERCAREGLLLSLPQLLSRCGAPVEAPRAELGGIAIRTADRPRLLARLLASVRKLEANGAARRRWVVFDDSRDFANERANRSAIDGCGLQVTHYGRAEAEALQSALRGEFPHAEREVAWLLGAGAPGQGTYGRPLNHALLYFAGRRFLTVDDDVVLEAHRPALAEQGFAVNDEADELLWYDDEAALWRDCPVLDIDPLAAHEKWLGLPLATAWARAEREAGAPAEIDLRPMHGRRFAPEARVVFTHNHACGDPGSSLLPLQLLTLPPRSRRWLTAHPGAAARAFAGRIDWRGQARLRLAPRRLLTLTTVAGIDNSRLLPPAVRSHRSEDVLLGIAAQCMYPSSWLVDLPFGLSHLREPAKHWLTPDANFMQEPLHVLYAWIDENATGVVAEAPEARLTAIGALLLDHAGMSNRVFAEALRAHAAEAGSRTLFAIAEQLADATLPAQWEELLVPWLKSPALAVDEASVAGRTLAPEAVRPLATAYGKAIHVWPQFWNFCRERFL
jgi:hypothetical protein